MEMKEKKLLLIFSLILFNIYFVLLIWVVIFKCNLENSIIQTYEYLKDQTLYERFTVFLIPFNDYFSGPFVSQWKNTLKDDLLNIILFVPLGLYLSYFIKSKKLLWTLIISFLISLFFEVIQLFSLIGSFSTKDLITNTVGGFVGYLFYKLVYKENGKKVRFIVLDVLSCLAIAFFLPISIYAFINTIENLNLYFIIIKGLI